MLGRLRRLLRPFDWAGIAALLALATVLGVDADELGWTAEEVSLEVDPEELEAGFREGVEWHGIYRDGEKLGFSRLERRRRTNGYRLATLTDIRSPSPLIRGRIRVEVVSDLDRRFRLERFTARVEGGPLPARAEGVIEGEDLVVTLQGLPGGDRALRFAVGEAPGFDFSIRPLLMREDLEPGDRFTFTQFDPLGLVPGEMTIEYAGVEPVRVMGEIVYAHHLRQRVAGEWLDAWVNDLGEVLRESLPGGLSSVRESEAEAIWETVGRGEQEAAG